MIARDVMTPSPVMVTASTPIADAARRMGASRASLMPVVDDLVNAHLQGIITDRDIIERCVCVKHEPGCVVGDHMTKHPLETVGPDDELTAVVRRMETARVHRVPVVEPGGRVVGIITRTDIAARGRTQPMPREQLALGFGPAPAET